MANPFILILNDRMIQKLTSGLGENYTTLIHACWIMNTSKNIIN